MCAFRFAIDIYICEQCHLYIPQKIRVKTKTYSIDPKYNYFMRKNSILPCFPPSLPATYPIHYSHFSILIQAYM